MFISSKCLISLKVILYLLLAAPFGLQARETSYDLLLDDPSDMQTIARENYPQVKNLYSSVEKYKEKLIKWNPHIENPTKINKGTELYLISPYSAFTGIEYAPTLNVGGVGEKGETRNIIDFDGTLGLFAFRRSLQQTTLTGPADLALEATQNSPVTAEAILYTDFIEHPIELESRIEYSLLAESEANTGAGTEILPSTREFGFDQSLLYRIPGIPKLLWSLGAQYQRLVTFNLEEVASGGNIQRRWHDIVYVSAGLKYDFKMFNLDHAIQTRYSQSFYSRTTLNKGKEDLQGFDTKRFEVEYHLNRENYFFYIFFNRENLESDVLNTSLNRVGVGLKYFIF